MTNLPRPASTRIERRQFDDFLFAPICQEQNGMPLTVLSALARLDVDPWHEAARLAKMSTESATERMRSLIAALPEETSAHANADAIAARLIGLLPPRQVIAGPMSTAIIFGNPGMAVRYRVIAFLILMALLLGPQLLVRSAQPPAPVDSVAGTASNIISSPSSPQ